MSAECNMRSCLWRSNVHWVYRTLFNWISSSENHGYIGETPTDAMGMEETKSGRSGR